jgi:hypothetical protein
LDGAIDQEWDISLVWKKHCSLSYDVYFGKSNPPNPPPLVASNIPSTTYTPPFLEPGTDYDWQVKAYGWQMGTTDCIPSALYTESSILSFRTKDGPRIDYDSYSPAVEYDGDHDGYIEKGEIWKLSVTMKNTGTMDADEVTATLDGDVAAYPTKEPLYVFNNWANNFGNIPMGGTRTLEFIFKLNSNVWYVPPTGNIPCGELVKFNIKNISAKACINVFWYPNKNEFYSRQVGLLDQTETMEGNPNQILAFSDGSRTSTLGTFNLAGLGSTFDATISISIQQGTGNSPVYECSQLDIQHNTAGDQPADPRPKDYCDNLDNVVSGYYKTHQAGTYYLILAEQVGQSCGNFCSGTIKANVGITQKISMSVTQHHDEACATYSGIGIWPTLGTTAGGTDVFIYGPEGTPGAFPDATLAVGFLAEDLCPTDLNGRSVIWVKAPDITWHNTGHISFKTPRFIEDFATILIENESPTTPPDDPDDPTTFDYCIPSGYEFRTLAFTANQITQDMSVVDTLSNGTFTPKPSMPLDPTVVAINIACNTGSHAGRRLYAVDYNSGNLEVYDASNFTGLGSVQLQNPAAEPGLPRTFDLTMSRDGGTMFVSHITSGMIEEPPPPWPINPTPGGITVLTLAAEGTPTPYDVDQDSNTTSEGAPAGSGITRLELNADGYSVIYPLSVKAVSITDGVSPYTYRDGEPFPGEYIFVSGVGTTRCTEYCTCEPRDPCPGPVLEPRPAIVAVIDNNPCLYCDAAHHPQSCIRPEFCQPGDAYYNSRYWKNQRNAYKAMGDGIDGLFLGSTSQELGFSLTSGTPPLGPTVYMLNRLEDKAYLFNYTQATGDWSVVMDPGNPLIPFTIPTGPSPTDVKVQKVGAFTRAYITNAGDDTVHYINTENNSFFNAYLEDTCTEIPVTDGLHYPTSIDTKGDGITGYVADFESRNENGKSTVSVFNLANPSSFPNHCNIEVGTAPIRIVVQPVPNPTEIFGVVRNSLAFAQPTDFTTPSKQSNLIRDWEDVHQLQETSADPQAVIANIAAFQKKVGSWVVNAALKKNLNEGINLYRSAYIHDHPSR